EEGIDTMTGLLKRKSLEIRLDCDLGNKEYLDSWVYHDAFDGHIMAQPLGIVAHISAGNVFVGAVDTLVQGIVTKNINIMKMSSVDPVFPILFARSIMEHDKEGILKGSIAMLHWKGGTPEIEDIIKKDCDALIVYGGAKTVESFREGLGLHTKIVEYGPKYSFILVDSSSLAKEHENVKKLARDIVMWEQSACSSPHVIYFEDNGFSIKEFSEELGKQLSHWHREIPQGKVYEDEAVEITRIREVARIEEAMGKGYLFTPDDGLEWTIVVQNDPEFTVSCHNRTIFIKPLEKLEMITEVVREEGKYIQTVSIVAEKKRSLELGKALIKLGADRIVGPGRMAVRKHGTPHDGTLGLAEFVRWASCSIMESEGLNEPDLVDGMWKQYNPESDCFDYLDDAVRKKYVLSKIKSIVKFASENAPLFKERFKDIKINCLDDIEKLPFLSGNDMKDFLPPGGNGILTDDIASGYVFSSGGTTGKPKVVYR
ncbi:CoF synthetase, partial [bacterium]|nr:CoF synthetase [bacterium]